MRRLHAILQRAPGIRRLRRVLPDRVWALLTRLLGPASSDRWHLPLRARVTERLLEASRRDSEAFTSVKTIDDWSSFLAPRLLALRESLGPAPDSPRRLEVRCSHTLRGDGFVIENLLFSSRPGSWVAANLYRPDPIAGPAPALVLCHSHHNPKSQAELQEMGAGWARAGCTVLVPDLVGHGERRDHPFHAVADHPRTYRVDRQDYWFRYVLGLQLDLVGESLMGWMVRDLMRGVDLLEARSEVDPARIVLIGSVAGGGDVAAVTAALDSRIACVVPFNFGRASPAGAGPTREWNFAGTGSWESTRNLRGSARHGFLPWSILAAVAPRRLIYAHEFDWSPAEDPVWTRLVRVWELHGAPGHLASVHGRGSGTGPPPHNTHCNNVGPIHRIQIDPLLRDWLGIPTPAPMPAERRSDSDLRCWTPESRCDLGPRAVHAIARDLASARLAAAWRDHEALPTADALSMVRARLAAVLGPVRPAERRRSPFGGKTGGGCEAVEITSEPGVRVGLRLWLPSGPSSSRPRVVVGFAQDGALALLRKRRAVVRGLLDAGLAVCLVDVRGAGASGHDDATRGRHSLATEVAASEVMLGDTLLGARLRDARSALGCLRGHTGLDTGAMAVWGDSLAPPNLPTHEVCVPFDAGASPTLAEPLGATLALLLAVFEPDVRAVCACGGLISFASLLDGPVCHVPRDVVVPGLLTVADVSDLLEALADVPVRIEAPTDGQNRLLAEDALRGFRAAAAARRDGRGGRSDLTVTGTRRAAHELVDWVARELGRPGSVLAPAADLERLDGSP